MIERERATDVGARERAAADPVASKPSVSDLWSRAVAETGSRGLRAKTRHHELLKENGYL